MTQDDVLWLHLVVQRIQDSTDSEDALMDTLEATVSVIFDAVKACPHSVLRWNVVSLVTAHRLFVLPLRSPPFVSAFLSQGNSLAGCDCEAN
jgi:hypothetical protein